MTYTTILNAQGQVIAFGVEADGWDHPVPPGGSKGASESVPVVVEPVPSAVTNAQGKAALIIMGKDTAVETIIDNIVDQTERKLAWNDYNNRLTWERSNARLQAIATAAGLDLDAMFTLAAQQ